ncbi:DNA-binding MarR family transcriptional regulator [Propionibacteriaceae bacterium ES.041]|uniref:MarR family winged helix-turn-helix transcriptional regulator n=1 Tax=Enemella evansiae TaxID=2016499 RepID=UPI000B9715C1|nr:MarR family transcriptional regulator [Enemella evansiae]OYN96830.1 MarR family transcriptional regulator [Enemella evansiae]PFG69134.1 DNA-binding MarR family transcriptional regulator [Propionibacteriaceae bacterium ES.041]
MAYDPDDQVDAIALAWLRERPGTSVESIGIVTRIWHAAKLFGDDRTRLLRSNDADAATLDLLSTLRRSGDPYTLTTRELAAAGMVTAGAISQRVDRAEKQGLVRRTPRGPGSRAVDVTLTAAGHATVERLVDAVLGRELELLESLDSEERETLARLLSKLLVGLQDELGTQRIGQVGD